MTTYNSFLKYLKGNWLLHENSFIFKNNEQKDSENFVTFTNCSSSDGRRKYYHNINILDNTYRTSYGKINNYLFLKLFYVKNYRDVLFYLKFIRKGLLTSIKLNFNKKVKQEEYIYIVNKNILINIILIKSLKNQYLSLKVSSYIRIKKI
uniref:Uncharacterized protein n=1 Tax=Vertebrata isogona TaxID=2006944 RepID=A0A1Z1MF19_9FLOR|nr:hypothetical protein [Vertebrata isogona]ARW64583.1 hypothetical protein [Vertebrata isogona]